MTEQNMQPDLQQIRKITRRTEGSSSAPALLETCYWLGKGYNGKQAAKKMNVHTQTVNNARHMLRKTEEQDYLTLLNEATKLRQAKEKDEATMKKCRKEGCHDQPKPTKPEEPVASIGYCQKHTEMIKDGELEP